MSVEDPQNCLRLSRDLSLKSYSVTPPRNILLIQDDASAAGAVREALTNSGDGPFQVEWVRRCSEGLERLARDAKKERKRTDAIAAVLVDLFLPDSHGIETFDRLHGAAPQIPIRALCFAQ